MFKRIIVCLCYMNISSNSFAGESLNIGIDTTYSTPYIGIEKKYKDIEYNITYKSMKYSYQDSMKSKDTVEVGRCLVAPPFEEGGLSRRRNPCYKLITVSNCKISENTRNTCHFTKEEKENCVLSNEFGHANPTEDSLYSVQALESQRGVQYPKQFDTIEEKISINIIEMMGKYKIYHHQKYRIYPYVKVGLGLAVIKSQSKLSTYELQNNRKEVKKETKRRIIPVYNSSLGIEWEINNKISLEIDYRFINKIEYRKRDRSIINLGSKGILIGLILKM